MVIERSIPNSPWMSKKRGKAPSWRVLAKVGERDVGVQDVTAGSTSNVKRVNPIWNKITPEQAAAVGAPDVRGAQTTSAQMQVLAGGQNMTQKIQKAQQEAAPPNWYTSMTPEQRGAYLGGLPAHIRAEYYKWGADVSGEEVQYRQARATASDMIRAPYITPEAAIAKKTTDYYGNIRGRIDKALGIAPGTPKDTGIRTPDLPAYITPGGEPSGLYFPGMDIAQFSEGAKGLARGALHWPTDLGFGVATALMPAAGAAMRGDYIGAGGATLGAAGGLAIGLGASAYEAGVAWREGKAAPVGELVGSFAGPTITLGLGRVAINRMTAPKTFFTSEYAVKSSGSPIYAKGRGKMVETRLSKGSQVVTFEEESVFGRTGLMKRDVEVYGELKADLGEGGPFQARTIELGKPGLTEQFLVREPKPTFLQKVAVMFDEPRRGPGLELSDIPYQDSAKFTTSEAAALKNLNKFVFEPIKGQKLGAWGKFRAKQLAKGVKYTQRLVPAAELTSPEMFAEGMGPVGVLRGGGNKLIFKYSGRTPKMVPEISLGGKTTIGRFKGVLEAEGKQLKMLVRSKGDITLRPQYKKDVFVDVLNDVPTIKSSWRAGPRMVPETIAARAPPKKSFTLKGKRSSAGFLNDMFKEKPKTKDFGDFSLKLPSDQGQRGAAELARTKADIEAWRPFERYVPDDVRGAQVQLMDNMFDLGGAEGGFKLFKGGEKPVILSQTPTVPGLASGALGGTAPRLIVMPYVGTKSRTSTKSRDMVNVASMNLPKVNILTQQNTITQSISKVNQAQLSKMRLDFIPSSEQIFKEATAQVSEQMVPDIIAAPSILPPTPRGGAMAGFALPLLSGGPGFDFKFGRKGGRPGLKYSPSLTAKVFDIKAPSLPSIAGATMGVRPIKGKRRRKR